MRRRGRAPGRGGSQVYRSRLRPGRLFLLLLPRRELRLFLVGEWLDLRPQDREVDRGGHREAEADREQEGFPHHRRAYTVSLAAPLFTTNSGSTGTLMQLTASSA